MQIQEMAISHPGDNSSWSIRILWWVLYRRRTPFSVPRTDQSIFSHSHSHSQLSKWLTFNGIEFKNYCTFFVKAKS